MASPVSVDTKSSLAQQTSLDAMFDNSGFVVNFGGGSVGGGVPSWVWMAGVGLVALWLVSHKR